VVNGTHVTGGRTRLAQTLGGDPLTSDVSRGEPTETHGMSERAATAPSTTFGAEAVEFERAVPATGLNRIHANVPIDDRARATSMGGNGDDSPAIDGSGGEACFAVIVSAGSS
jgi:hypothetical protein